LKFSNRKADEIG